MTPRGTDAVSWGGVVLVEGREDRAAPRRRGGGMVRERDRPEGHDDMASKVSERMSEGDNNYQIGSN